MTIPFQQTGNATGCGTGAYCAGGTDNADTCDFTAEYGGTPYNKTTQLDFAGGVNDKRAIWWELVPGSGFWYNNTTTWTVRINVTSGNSNIRLKSIYVCHLNASCTSLATIGTYTSLTGYAMTAGVKSFSVTGAAPGSIAWAADSKVMIICLFRNMGFGAESITIQSDQIIDVPFDYRIPLDVVESEAYPFPSLSVAGCVNLAVAEGEGTAYTPGFSVGIKPAVAVAEIVSFDRQVRKEPLPGKGGDGAGGGTAQPDTNGWYDDAVHLGLIGPGEPSDFDNDTGEGGQVVPLIGGGVDRTVEGLAGPDDIDPHPAWEPRTPGAPTWLYNKWRSTSRPDDGYFIPAWLRQWSLDRCGKVLWGMHTITQEDIDGGYMTDEWTEDDIGFDRPCTLHPVRATVADGHVDAHLEVCRKHFGHITTDREGWDMLAFCYMADDAGDGTGEPQEDRGRAFVQGDIFNSGYPQALLNRAYAWEIGQSNNYEKGDLLLEEGEEAFVSGMRLPRHYLGRLLSPTVECGDIV